MRCQNARFTLSSNSIELLISRRIRSISIIPSLISAVELANFASSKVHLLHAPHCLVLGLCAYLFPGGGLLCDWLYLDLRFIRGSYLLRIAGDLTVLEIWGIVSLFVCCIFWDFPIYLIQDSNLSFKKKKNSSQGNAFYHMAVLGPNFELGRPTHIPKQTTMLQIEIVIKNPSLVYCKLIISHFRACLCG